MNAREFVTRLSYRVDDSGRRQYDRGVEQVKKSIERLRDSARRSYDSVARVAATTASHSAKSWKDAHGKMRDENGRFVKHAKFSLASLEANYSKFAKKIGKKLIYGGVAVGAAALGAGMYASKQIYDVGSSLETQKAALETVTGSQAKANKEFARLEEYAKKTPSRLGDVIEAYTRLTSLGLEPSERALNSYGNTASAMGKPLMQMVEAVADAATGEFERLKEFGIRASKDGDDVAFTFQGVTTKMKMDSKSIQEYLLRIGETKFAGGMERQAKTIGGKMSTLQDTIEGVARKLWEGPMHKNAHALMDWAQKFLDKHADKFTTWLTIAVEKGQEFGTRGLEFVKDAGPKVLFFLSEARKVLPFVITFLGTMAARFVGLKAIAGGMWLFNAIKTIRTLTWSTMALNTAAFVIPVAIGAVIAAIGWVGYQVYKYVTQGEKGIESLRKKFPWLADSIVYLGEVWKGIQPYVQEFLAKVWDLIGVIGKHLLPIAEWVFKTLIVGYIISVITIFATLIDWIRVAADFWLPKIKQGFEDWKAGAQVIFDWFGTQFDRFFGWLGKVGNMAGGAFDTVANMFGLGNGNSSSGPNPLDDPNFPFSNRVADQLVANAYKVYSGAGRCLNGVYQAYMRTTRGTALNYYSAADSAVGLAKDTRYKEITVTPEMLRDPRYRQMLHGAIAVYNRASGFSKKHGHIEVWDTKNMKALFGNGAQSLNRNARNLANAKVFIPIDPTAGRAPVGNGRGGGNTQIINNTANLTQNIGATHGTPSQIGKAGADGVSHGLNNVANNKPRLK